MTRRGAIPLAVAGVALVVAALALLLRERPVPEPLPIEDVERSVVARPTIEDGREPEPVRGGVYAGRVVDAEDRPVANADVFLVAESTGEKVAVDAGDGTVLDVPSYGNHFTAQTVKTESDGRFRGSGGDAAVVALVAWHPAHAPGILTADGGLPLPPGEDLVVRLPAPGRLVGRVVDAATGAPVPNAEVTIFVQHAANQEKPGPRPFTATNAFARFQAWAERDLAPLAWGIQTEVGQQGLRVWTDPSGTFRFGPISDEVQLWVVITHPEYKWVEFDPEVRFGEDAGRRRRLVIPAGQTVERTYALPKGNEITGILLDKDRRPIPDVAVSLEHIVQVAQAPWFRTHARKAVTDARGRFRLAGLDRGPYTLKFQHLAFGTVHEAEAVPEGTRDKEFLMPTAGFVVGRVEGGPEDRPAFPAVVRLEPITEGPRRSPPREVRVLVERGFFRVDRVDPGSVRLWVTFAGQVSVPQTIEVRPSEGTEVTVALTEGASVVGRVVDADGRPVDPATVVLRPLDAGGIGGGQVLARSGEFAGKGLPPGRYGATVQGPGYIDLAVEPFALSAGGTHDLGRVTLRQYGYLKIVSLHDETGRVPSVEVMTTIQEGEKPPQVKLAIQGLIRVEPGPVTVRSKSADGKAYEEAFQVSDGETVEVRIVLRTP